MRKNIACTLVSAVVAMTTLTTAHAGLLRSVPEAMTAPESIDIIHVRYYGGADFIAGTALGFAGAFVLTNRYYPDCSCYRSYPHYYYHHYHYPDRFYHFGDFRSYY